MCESVRQINLLLFPLGFIPIFYTTIFHTVGLIRTEPVSTASVFCRVVVLPKEQNDNTYKF